MRTMSNVMQAVKEMTMPRSKSVKTIDARISIVKDQIKATKARYARLGKELQKLEQERDAALALEIIQALKKSRKSYDELMTFLGR